MLACARIGATHSVVFGGFSADALAGRIQDASAKVVITADGGYRRGKPSALKPTVDEAVAELPERSSTCWWSAAPARRSPGPTKDLLVARDGGDGQPRSTRRSRSTPSTRCSSSTPAAPRPSRRASCTPPAAT